MIMMIVVTIIIWSDIYHIAGSTTASRASTQSTSTWRLWTARRRGPGRRKPCWRTPQAQMSTHSSRSSQPRIQSVSISHQKSIPFRVLPRNRKTCIPSFLQPGKNLCAFCVKPNPLWRNQMLGKRRIVSLLQWKTYSYPAHYNTTSFAFHQVLS